MRTLAIITVAALALVACGGSSEQSASDAAEQMYSYMGKGQFGRDYDMLHPAHQAVVARERFIECAQGSAGFSVSKVGAEEEFDEDYDVARVGLIPTRAVTLKYNIGELEQHRTIHMVDVDGSWRWIMGEDDLSAYESGNCP